MDQQANTEQTKGYSVWIHLIIAIGALMFLAFMVNHYQVIQSNEHIKKKYERELVDREEKLSTIADKIIDDYRNSTLNFEKTSRELEQISGLVFIYDNDSLVFWSSNFIDPSKLITSESHKVVKLKNGWYKLRQTRKNGVKLLEALLIKHEFAYTNEYLKKNFITSTVIHANSEISLLQDELNIYDQDGNFLFSIIREKHDEIRPDQAMVLFIIFQFTIILFLSLIFKLYRKFEYLFQRKWIIPILLIVDIIIFWIILNQIKIPSVLFNSYLYLPNTFADLAHNSIADLFTNTIFFLYITYALACFPVSLPKTLKYNKIRHVFTTIAMTLFFFFVFYFYEQTIISLFQNSQISIELGQKFLSNTSISIISFIILGSLSLSLYFTGRFVWNYYNRIFTDKKSRWLSGLVLVMVYLTAAYAISELRFCSIILFIFFTLSFLLSKREDFQISTSQIVGLLLLFAIYLGMLSTAVLSDKEIEQRKSIAESIANNRDPLAEYTFNNSIQEIYKDTMILQNLHNYENTEVEALLINRVKNYFEKESEVKFVPYITICDTSRLLNIQPENYLINCIDYFRGIITEFGIPTNHPDLFHINNNSINNSYLAVLYFPSDLVGKDTYIYIELISEFIPEGLGYPELLIDETTNLSGADLVNYSFAKYRNDELVYKFGDYDYSINLQNYNKLAEGQKRFYNNQYNHLLIKRDELTSFIISKENRDIIEAIAPFSYYFITLALFIFIFYLVTANNLSFKIQISFRNRLQFSILGVILISFLVIGFTTMLYLIRLNDKKNHEILSEKAHSVLIELEHKLAEEDNISPDMYEYLNSLLTKFSLVFFSDIHLYSLQGELIASSRQQIFEVGLLSRLMNVIAYDVLANQEKLLFIQKENVGSYEYLSAYVPFRNSQNKLVAYLNLPYFARQTELQIEITTFLITLVNIYVLFFVIAIMVTIVISRWISKPLQLIRQSISGIRLGKTNQKIDWTRKDEIGSLIAEYNRMIDELSLSANLLAQSERESAWREMAKQVAHEIKNPLTPMKLSVQYLKKAWDEKEQDFDRRLNRFTKTIVEQIDSLSEIANAFSNFAKMPSQKIEWVDLKEIIKNTIDLFKENTTIIYKLEVPKDDCKIKADKNQMLRVFNNLIKNAVQAIGDKNDGEIKFLIRKTQLEMIIEIADNGSGITVEMSEKIFSPNFTTKTSGMGLGLAMVKSIIINSGGKIWFESVPDKGTKFFMSFPLTEIQD